LEIIAFSNSFQITNIDNEPCHIAQQTTPVTLKSSKRNFNSATPLTNTLPIIDKNLHHLKPYNNKQLTGILSRVGDLFPIRQSLNFFLCNNNKKEVGGK